MGTCWMFSERFGAVTPTVSSPPERCPDAFSGGGEAGAAAAGAGAGAGAAGGALGNPTAPGSALAAVAVKHDRRISDLFGIETPSSAAGGDLPIGFQRSAHAETL